MESPPFYREKKPRPVYPAGLTAFDTAVYLFSFMYPFRLNLNRDKHRIVHVFEEQPGGGTVLECRHFVELPGRLKKHFEQQEKRRAVLFYILVAALTMSFVLSYKIFSILMVAALLGTLYDYLDHRIRFYWLRREFNYGRPDAASQSPDRTEKNTADS